jgi:flagella basal body P-ring formation protein FlgA
MVLRTLTLLFILASSSLQAEQGVHSLGEIREQAEQYALQAVQSASPKGSQIHLKVGKLNRHLSLQQCEQELELFLHNGKLSGSHITIGARCLGQQPWTVYLPMSVQRHAEVFVSNRRIKRDQIIQRHDIRREILDLSRLHRGYIDD